MRTSSTVTVPFWKSLMSESSWRQDSAARVFSIVRWHLVLKSVQLAGPAKHGQRIGGFAGKDIEFRYSKQVEQLDLEKSISASSTANETLQSLTEEVGLVIGARGFTRIGAGTRKAVTERVTSEFSQSFEFHARTKRTEEMGSTIPKLDQPMALVQRYLRYRTVVFLGYLDYLVVEYQAAPFAIRVKRRKYPAPHQNIVKFNVPILGFEHWGLYPGITWVNEDDYQQDIMDPQEITYIDPSSSAPGHIAFPRQQPSLHRIANGTFPLKWSKRSGPWTKEELMAIELDEYTERAQIVYNRPRFGRRTA